MTKVVVIANPRTDPEYAEGYHYALEVREGDEVIHRWTYRTFGHAEQERQHVARWFYLPTSVLEGEGSIPC